MDRGEQRRPKYRFGAAIPLAIGIVSLLGAQRGAWAVLGIDINVDTIDNVAFVNDSVNATPLYSTTLFSPTFGSVGFGIPFNNNYGQGSVVAVIDLGLIDNTNPALTKVANYFNIALPSSPQATPPANLVGDHGTAVAKFAAGYNATTSDNVVAATDFGIAPLATVWSGSIILSGDPNSEANIQTNPSVIYPFVQTMNVGVNGTKADVINASFGATGVPASDDWFSQALDGLAKQNSHTTIVIAAGNNEVQPTQVSSPAASFNNIAVAALGADPSLTYQNVAWFSNRGPNDFYNPNTNLTIPNVRATVDIAAPGDEFIVQAIPTPGQPGYYSIEYGSGTSYAAPLVSGAIAQLTAYAHGLTADVGFLQFFDAKAPQRVADAFDSRVIKAVLLNSAHKTAGWDNGQTLVSGVITTTQGLDYNVGAGALDVAAAANNYLNGTFDPQVVGTQFVGPMGWDLSTVTAGSPNVYLMGTIPSGVWITATLDWFADTSFDYTSLNPSADRFANLTLEILEQISPTEWKEIAVSEALYNNVQHLYFQAPDTANYAVEVLYAGVQYAPVGDTTNSQTYALAWAPEPGTLALAAPALLLISLRRRRR